MEAILEMDKQEQGSLAQIVAKAVKTSDHRMLDFVCQLNDKEVVQKASSEIQKQDAILLLDYITEKSRLSPVFAFQHCVWIVNLLRYHGKSFLANPAGRKVLRDLDNVCLSGQRLQFSYFRTYSRIEGITNRAAHCTRMRKTIKKLRNLQGENVKIIREADL